MSESEENKPKTAGWSAAEPEIETLDDAVTHAAKAIESLAPSKLLDDEGLARFLRVSAGTVKKWRTEGVGPAYIRLGKAIVRYQLADVLKWLEERRVEPRKGALP